MKRLIVAVLVVAAACQLQRVRRECRTQCEHVRGSAFPPNVPPKIWDQCMRDCEARDGIEEETDP